MATGPVVIVAPTIVRYTFHMLLEGNRRCDNIVDISIEGVDIFDRSTVIDDFNTHINIFWQERILKGMYGTTTLFQGSNFLDLDSPAGDTGFLAPVAGHPTSGTNTPPFAPHNTCYLVHKNSIAHRGQRQGRMYVPNIPEGKVGNAGDLDGTWRSLVGAVAESFRTDIGTYTYTGVAEHPAAMRVVHVRKPDKNDATTWVWSSSTVDQLVIDPYAATQRRRMRD